MRRLAKLIMVTAENNNKFYDMVENDDGSISIDYGRVGVTSTKLTYPAGAKKWESLYNAKVKKGYVDQTQLRVVSATGGSFLGIKDQEAAGLVTALTGYAKQSVVDNYTVAVEAVTQAQVDRAQSILDQIPSLLHLGVATKSINDQLLALYGVIPRRMRHVQEHLIADDWLNTVNLDDARKIVANEQATLDVMRGQVATGAVQATSSQTVLQAMGIDITPFDSEETAVAKEMMGKNANQFRRGFRVVNVSSAERYNANLLAATDKTQAKLWHGSRNENWWNILKTGLLIRPANAVITGAMFGYGIYAASKAQKSIGYTSLHGSYWAKGGSHLAYLGIFQFHLGRMYRASQHEGWMCGLDYQKLCQRGGYESFYAQAGTSLFNDEYIVYQPQQVTIWGIVEIV